MPIDSRQELVDLVAGVDDDALAGVLAPDHESVLEKRFGRARLDDHDEPVPAPILAFPGEMTTTPTYKEAVRVHTSLLAAVEKRCLIWMAERMPRPVNSDHLTALAGVVDAGGRVLLLERLGGGACSRRSCCWP